MSAVDRGYFGAVGLHFAARRKTQPATRGESFELFTGHQRPPHSGELGFDLAE